MCYPKLRKQKFCVKVNGKTDNMEKGESREHGRGVGARFELNGTEE